MTKKKNISEAIQKASEKTTKDLKEASAVLATFKNLFRGKPQIAAPGVKPSTYNPSTPVSGPSGKERINQTPGGTVGPSPPSAVTTSTPGATSPASTKAQPFLSTQRQRASTEYLTKGAQGSFSDRATAAAGGAARYAASEKDIMSASNVGKGGFTAPETKAKVAAPPSAPVKKEPEKAPITAPTTSSLPTPPPAPVQQRASRPASYSQQADAGSSLSGAVQAQYGQREAESMKKPASAPIAAPQQPTFTSPRQSEPIRKQNSGNIYTGMAAGDNRPGASLYENRMSFRQFVRGKK